MSLRKQYALGSTALMLLLSVVGQARATIYNGPSASDVDTDPATNVSLTVPDSGNIIKVTLSARLSGFADNVSIWLSHDGVALLPIYTGEADSFPDSPIIDATWDDAASGPAPASGSAVGTFTPVQPLSAFNGLDVFGTWTLTLKDTGGFPGDGTLLESWSIDVTTDGIQVPGVPEPSSILLVALGAIVLLPAGCAAARKKYRRA
ncbi:MAG: PEP-CTERM sorting domain-containing protein [Planctomycetia bacterium]|nr:PEP-CTERM sorting domain-containing protein [Planctomycetia bacterium]